MKILLKNVPVYEVVVGSPAKISKSRFYKATIKLIENSKWCKNTPDECIKYYVYIDKADEFGRRINDDKSKGC